MFVPSSIIYATIDAAVEFLPQFHEMLMGCGIRSRSRSLAHSIRARTVDPSLALELELESWHSMTTAATAAAAVAKRAKSSELSLPDCARGGGFATRAGCWRTDGRLYYVHWKSPELRYPMNDATAQMFLSPPRK